MWQAEAILLLLSTVTHFALILFPCFAVCAVAVRKGIRDIILLGLIALVTIAASGYLAFWFWFISPQLGGFFSLCLPIAAVVLLIWICPRLDTAGRSALYALLAPIGLVGAAALLVLSTGFMFGGLDDPLHTASIRFSHPLPGDNEASYVLAEVTRRGEKPEPLGDWHLSDRPPLLSGIVLSQRPYLQHPQILQYTVISVIAQSLWIFALWLFLAAFDLDPRAIALALAVCLFSGFVFLNSFYVWPKLLAGAYMLAASAVLLADRFAVVLRTTTFIPLLSAALATFGLLAHGGSVFAIIGIVLTMLVIRRSVNAKTLVLMAAACICLYLPWILYQKLYDPPGDRLLKWHLAGVQGPDPRPFLQLLASAYRNLTFHQYVDNKLANVKAVADHQAEYWHYVLQLLCQMATSTTAKESPLRQTAGTLRALCFFFFVPNLGCLVLGPISLVSGILQRYRSREWKFAAIVWIFIAFTAMIWCIIMFVPGKTVIHQGAYATVLLAYAGSILALWAVSHWLAVIVASLQIELNFLLYISFMEPQGSLRYGILTLSLFVLIAGLLLLKSLARRQTAEAKT